MLKRCVICILYGLFCLNTANRGVAAGIIIYYLSYQPFDYFGTNVSAKAKFGISLVPSMAMGIGCMTLTRFESTGELIYLSYLILAMGQTLPSCGT